MCGNMFKVVFVAGKKNPISTLFIFSIPLLINLDPPYNKVQVYEIKFGMEIILPTIIIVTYMFMNKLRILYVYRYI